MKSVIAIDGYLGTTSRVACTDTAAVLSTSVYQDANGRTADVLLITCEDANVRFAFGTNPTQGARAVGHVIEIGESYRLDQKGAIASVKFINAENGSDGALQITPVFFGSEPAL